MINEQFDMLITDCVDDYDYFPLPEEWQGIEVSGEVQLCKEAE